MSTDRFERKWIAFSAIGVSLITIVFSSTMVFVLLSSIAEDFGVTLRAVGWVVIIESLIVSALLLPMGGVADRIGRRRVYVAGMVVFGIGSVLTGLAPTFGVLIGARAIMALGNALVQSVMTAMIVAVFPPEERGKAIGAQTTAVSIGAAFGPLFAGVALQVVSWEMLFLVLAIPSVLSIVAALAILPDDRPSVRVAQADQARFDPIGAVLAGAIVVSLVVTIGNPFAFSWLSAPILGGVLIVVVSTVAFIRWELRHHAPMLELRLFALPVFRNAVSVRFIGFIGPATMALLLPIYLISFREESDAATGLVIFLVAVGMGISAQISGNLSDRVGPRAPTVVGLVLQMAVSGVLVVWAETISFSGLAVAVFASGFASGFWNVPNNSAMMGTAPPESQAVVGAFTNVTRTMGTVLGQAIATAIVVGVMAGRGFDIPLDEIVDTPGAGLAFVDGWRWAYVAVIAASALVLVVAGLGLPSTGRGGSSQVMSRPNPDPSTLGS